MWAKQALQAFAGLLAALVAAALTLIVIFVLLASLDSAEIAFADVQEFALSVAIIVAIDVFPIVFVGGAVLYLLYRWFGWFKPGQSAVGGAILGALLIAVAQLRTGDWYGLFSLEILGTALLGALVGMIGGLVFWWIAGRPLAAQASGENNTAER